MPPRKKQAPTAPSTVKELKDTLWKAADKLRGSMDASQYKDVILGLVFLKYVSDAFDERRGQIEAELSADGFGAEDIAEQLDDAGEYIGARVFWVAPHARWGYLATHAKGLPAAGGEPAKSIGDLIDDAMDLLMGANRSLHGTLPRMYGRDNVDQRRLGELIDLFNGARFTGEGATKARDLLGEVYEYFLENFARAEGKRGGEFYTPASVVRVLVNVLEPTRGRVYDPCCGSGGMFVQAEKFLVAHERGASDLAVYGQESIERTWRLAKMNLAIHGIDSQGLGSRWGDTLARDIHPDVVADFVLANPPFNQKEWARSKQDKRWKFGVPAGNANYAWIQHVISKLGPAGSAGVVMANGAATSTPHGELQIRANIVEADLVSCMVALPTQLFRSTGIPATLWFFAKDKSACGESGRGGVGSSSLGSRGTIDRTGQVLFIDARELGYMVDRAERALSDDDIARIANTYHLWRGMPLTATPSAAREAPATAGRVGRSDEGAQAVSRPGDSPTAAREAAPPTVGRVGRSDEGAQAVSRLGDVQTTPAEYIDIPGFCKSVTLAEIKEAGYALTPGRYVGTPEPEDDGEPIDLKIKRLSKELFAVMDESAKLDAVVREQLARLG